MKLCPSKGEGGGAKKRESPRSKEEGKEGLEVEERLNEEKQA